jgi:L-lactate permease
LPLILAAILLVAFNWPARRAMPVVPISAAVIGLTAWEMTFNRVLASTLQGLILTGASLGIIFGAILLLNTLTHSGAITAIRSEFSNKNKRPPSTREAVRSTASSAITLNPCSLQRAPAPRAPAHDFSAA